MNSQELSNFRCEEGKIHSDFEDTEKEGTSSDTRGRHQMNSKFRKGELVLRVMGTKERQKF